MSDDPWSDILPEWTAGYCHRCGTLVYVSPPMVWVTEHCGEPCMAVVVSMRPLKPPRWPRT